MPASSPQEAMQVAIDLQTIDVDTQATQAGLLTAQATLQTTAQQTLATQTTLIAAAATALAANALPTAATARVGATAVDAITAVTPVAVIAFSTASTSLYITDVFVSNTAADAPLVVLEDTADTPVVLDYCAPAAVAGVNLGKVYRHYLKPLKCTTAKGLNARCTGTAGAVQVIAFGYSKAD